MSGVGSNPHPDDLEPERTEGFKVGEKKTIDEYQQLGMYFFRRSVSVTKPCRARISSISIKIIYQNLRYLRVSPQ